MSARRLGVLLPSSGTVQEVDFFRAFDARDTIAAALGVPVVTSNQAALDAALRTLDGDRHPTGPGAGRR